MATEQFQIGYEEGYSAGWDAALAAPQPARLHVGDSRFESWYAGVVWEPSLSDKQKARVIYEAGLNDPAPQPKGLFVDMIAEHGPEFVKEMAQPVQSPPLTDKQIVQAWISVSDPIAVAGKFEDSDAIRQFVRAIEAAIKGGAM